MFRALLNLGLPVLVIWSAVSVLRRRRRGEETGNLGFRPVSPGGNPVFAPIHFGGGEAKVEQVDEAWRGGAAPPIPGLEGLDGTAAGDDPSSPPRPTDFPQV